MWGFVVLSDGMNKRYSKYVNIIIDKNVRWVLKVSNDKSFPLHTFGAHRMTMYVIFLNEFEIIWLDVSDLFQRSLVNLARMSLDIKSIVYYLIILIFSLNHPSFLFQFISDLKCKD